MQCCLNGHPGHIVNSIIHIYFQFEFSYNGGINEAWDLIVKRALMWAEAVRRSCHFILCSLHTIQTSRHFHSSLQTPFSKQWQFQMRRGSVVRITFVDIFKFSTVGRCDGAPPFSPGSSGHDRKPPLQRESLCQCRSRSRHG